MQSNVLKLWQDVVRCHLLTADESRSLAKNQKELGAEPATARELAQWLVAGRHITPYHAKALLAGHVGPFCFGDYRVNDRLPGGGHTRRFAGIHLPTKHKVLLHFCSNPEDLTDEQWAAECNYFDRHRAIVDPYLDRCYETITRTKHKIAITENVKGENVAELLEAEKRLSIPLACDVVRQAAIGMNALDRTGMIHGLIQPDRLVVQKSGHVRLLRDPTTIASPVDLYAPDPKGYLQKQSNYFAPELMTTDRSPDVRTDIYALGCTLFELLVGRPPFDGGSIHEKMVRHSQEPIISLTDAVGASTELADAVALMMAKNYNVRFGTPQQVIEALAPFCGASPANRTVHFRSTEIRYCEQLRGRLQATSDDNDIPHGQAADESDVDQSPTRVASAQESRISRQRQSNGAWWIKCLCGLVAIAAIGTVALVLNHLVTDPTPTRQETLQRGQPSTTSMSTKNVSPSERQLDVTPTQDRQPVGLIDDGVSLWQSPTAGESLALDFVPSGVQFFGSVDMQSLLTEFEGRRVMQALGPEFQMWKNKWQTETNIRFDQICLLVFAQIGRDVGRPHSILVLHLTNREPIDALLTQHRTKAVGCGRTWTHNGRDFLAVQDRPVLVIGDAKLVTSAANGDGKAPLLRRELELLRQATDVNRHFNLVATKNFLAGDGKELFAERRNRSRNALLQLVGEETQASLLSFHCSDRTFYGELRIAGATDSNPHQMSQRLKERIDEAPAAVVDFLGTVPVDPYWQRLALQVPMMTRFMVEHTRVAPDSKQVIANVVLPPNSAHSLVLATEIVSAIGGESALPTTQPPTYSIQAILDHVTSNEFAQQSLEFAVRDLGLLVNEQLAGANLTIRIVGADLQLEGITRNQQISGFRQQNASVAKILTELLVKANPDTTVSSSSDEKQKLVWVIDKQASNPTILVTTRDAAKKNAYDLPPEFRAP